MNAIDTLITFKQHTLSMKTLSLCSALLALAGLSTGAQAVIVDIDATTSNPVEHTFAAGTYTFAVVGKAEGGKYDGWTYQVDKNGAPASGVREAFSVSTAVDGTYVAFDTYSSTNTYYNSYATAAEALDAFAKGPYVEVQGTTATTVASTTYTFAKATTLYFSVPDYKFDDNAGGVSLSVTSAVPETQGYAMALLGLGGVGFVARRRRDL